MEIAIAQATIRLSVSTYEGGRAEFLGNGTWHFERSHVERFAAEKSDARFALEHADESDEVIDVSNADEAIAILAAMGAEGGQYAIAYTSENGSGYWAYHDIQHALFDCDDGTVYVDEAAELRALLQGAKLARQHGESLAGIVRELVKAEKEFETRFSFEADSLDSFLTWIDAGADTLSGER